MAPRFYLSNSFRQTLVYHWFIISITLISTHEFKHTKTESSSKFYILASLRSKYLLMKTLVSPQSSWLGHLRWQCLIYNGTLKSLFSSRNELDIQIFTRFIFFCGFSAKLICAFPVNKKIWRNHQINHFSSQKNDANFHINYKIKVSRVPL